MSLSAESIHLRDYWEVLSKRRYIAMLFFFLAVTLAAIYSFSAPQVYQGTTSILIEQEINPTMSFGEGGTARIQMRSTDEYQRTQKEILLSRAFADRVVKRLQLDKSDYFLKTVEREKDSLSVRAARLVRDALDSIFPDRKPSAPFDTKTSSQETNPDLTLMVLSRMEVDLDGKTNILRIKYKTDNPWIAAYMANGIADSFIEHNLDIRVKPYRDAVEWLSSRMVELRGKVEDSAKTLQQYKEGKGIVSFESKENVITQELQELVTQMVQTEGKLQEAEARYNQIRSVVDNPELLATIPDIMNNKVIEQLRLDELQMRKQMSELSLKYGPKHPHMIKLKSEVEVVQKNLVSEARKMLNAAKTEYEIAKSRRASLRKAIDDQKQHVLDLSRKAIDFNVVAGEAESNKQFYELLLKKLQEASLSSGINISNAQVIDRAVVPNGPIKPRKAFNMAVAALIGLFGGVLLALFIEYMDDTLKTSDDVNKFIGLPYLNFIPHIKVKKSEHGMIAADPKSIAAESYRTIRTGIMLLTAETPPRVMLVTSSVPHEGKTTTTANLAMVLAQMGEKVLVIDADMRRHNIHKFFGLDNSAGLSDVIVGRIELAGAVKTIDGHPNLHVITGGTLAPNPIELLASERMKELLKLLRSRYDRILLDSPPVMAVSDPLILSRFVDGVVMVIWGGVTSREVVRKSAQTLSGVNAKMLGVVLNNINIRKMGYYSYYPYYQYTQTKAK